MASEDAQCSWICLGPRAVHMGFGPEQKETDRPNRPVLMVARPRGDWVESNELEGFGSTFRTISTDLLTYNGGAVKHVQG